MLIDTSRHYQQLNLLMDLVEAMSYSKLNVLHIHFTDDQSFPVVSETYPLLSQKGAYDQNHIYTHDNIRALVKYAKERGVRIIPEFDTPAHCNSWGMGYPEFLICGTTVGTGYPNPILNSTYDLIRGFFTEMTTLFDDEFIHVGGDETTSSCYQNNPNFTQWLKDHNTNNTAALMQFYEYNVQNIVTSIGKRVFMWEDVVEWQVDSLLANNSIADVWAGYWQWGAGICTNINQSWVLSSCFSLNTWQWPYTCDPYNFSISYEAVVRTAKGGHSSMWGEYVDSSNYMISVWPNGASLGERLWCPYNTTQADYSTFSRLVEHRCRLVRRGVPSVPLVVGYCPFEYVPPLEHPDVISQSE